MPSAHGERTPRSSASFGPPFCLLELRGRYPPGSYAVEVSQEPIEGMMLAGYWRTQSAIERPSNPASFSRQGVEFEPANLEAALARDLETGSGKS